MIEEDYLKIETPENIDLQIRLAGVGTRFVAGLYDNIILLLMYLIIFVIFLIINSAGFNQFNDVATGILIVSFFVIYWGYYTLMEWLRNGQTIGKKKACVKVVKENGAPITFADVAIRNLLRVVDSLPGFYFVAGIFMLFSKKTQRLGDMASGCIVISEEMPQYAAKEKEGRQEAWYADVDAEALEAIGLTQKEFDTLYNFWRRRSELDLEAQYQILPKLLEPILTKMGREVPLQHVGCEQILDELITKLMHTGSSRTDESGSNR